MPDNIEHISISTSMSVLAAKQQLQPMKPHIVVLPSPGMGHVVPLFQLAERLVTHHACHVTFLNIPTEASPAQTQLLHHSPNNLPPGLRVIDLPTVDLSATINGDPPVLTRLCINVQQTLLSLKSTLSQLHNKPRALVIDLFCTQAFEVCKELSIPVYTFFTASTLLLAFSLLLPQLDREVTGEFVDLPEPVSVPGCSPIRTEDLILQVTDRKSDEYKWYLHHLSRVPLAAGIFLNTWENLEPVSIRALREHPFYQKISTPPLYPIGPIIKETEPLTPTGVECLAWLDKQPLDSVVFVALGSGGTVSAEQLTELAWGLELSQQRFIWVARAPSDVNACAAFFNAGDDVYGSISYLPQGFLERTRGVGLVVSSWAPQVAILRHPSTAAFLSHCGWNSTLESLAQGVPMIAWPLYAEQRQNATMLAEEIGVAVKPAVEAGTRVVGREEIEKVVRVSLEGEEGKGMRLRARELKASASKALEFGGSSYSSLADVVEQWKAKLET
ncbi:hypothetical protein L6164_029670 [Bauhinia variegata]|uniref:Uncharacterized protein n=1 Tax=Bauhinia variegata TaxID=167791 RepID=A0ACB9LAJ1_BAUVA|nr:hypothetical protein L6164_029670 [Bauhinia variegata]